MTVSDPGAGRDLSDVSSNGSPAAGQVILDRDPQPGELAVGQRVLRRVSVGGIRIGPNVTIRQAGGAILVDNHPITGPYTILAIGPPNTMRDTFERSPGSTGRWLLEASYGAGVTVSTGDGLTLPPVPPRRRIARQAGS